jgi:preprotein translocase subunit YajC
MTSLQLMMQLVVFSTIALGTVYFLFYRPTVDAQRKARRVVADLQLGDEVVTSSGFFGRVVGVSEGSDGQVVVSLDLGSGLVVRARITAITELVNRPEAVAAPAVESPRPAGGPVAREGV